MARETSYNICVFHSHVTVYSLMNVSTDPYCMYSRNRPMSGDVNWAPNMDTMFGCLIRRCISASCLIWIKSESGKCVGLSFLCATFPNVE